MRKLERCTFFYDGFNFYHAIDELRKSPSTADLKAWYQFPKNTPTSRVHHLKWLDIYKVSKRLLSLKTQKIEEIYYFSAYAYWLPGSEARHREYVKALLSVGVQPVMGNFKRKKKARSYEEKESDVALGAYLVDLAYKDAFDAAYIVTRDSDFVPAVKIVKKAFPKKRIVLVTPPARSHVNEMAAEATEIRSILPRWLDACLFDAEIRDSGGNIIAKRPPKYKPPA